MSDTSKKQKAGRLHAEIRTLPRGYAKEMAVDPEASIKVTFYLRRRPGNAWKRTRSGLLANPKRIRTPAATFARAFGASASEVAKVARFIQRKGAKIVASSIERRSVIAEASARTFCAMLNIRLFHYRRRHHRFMSHAGKVTMPRDLRKIVQSVIGLDERPLPCARHLASGVFEQSSLSPITVARLYNFPAGTGSGQTIGIFAMPSANQTVSPGYDPRDVAATLTGFSKNLTVPSISSMPSPEANCGVSARETLLDITVAAAIAPGANIVVYFSPSNSYPDIFATLHDMLNPLIGAPIPTVISISYGFCGDKDPGWLSDAYLSTLSELFEDAAARGITVLASSGDQGSYAGLALTAETWYPASDPNVLACGGTAIGNVDGENFDERPWKDAYGATGGGISARIPVPSYQVNTPLPASQNGGSGRGVPDISGNASPDSGYMLSLQGKTAGPFAGTSAVAPLYAGLIARISSNLQNSTGNQQFQCGFLNPKIYKSGSALCRDIDGTLGPTNNSFNAAPGYLVTPGWDACTGFGSVNGMALQTSLLNGG